MSDKNYWLAIWATLKIGSQALHEIVYPDNSSFSLDWCSFCDNENYFKTLTPERSRRSFFEEGPVSLWVWKKGVNFKLKQAQKGTKVNLKYIQQKIWRI
jgi:hypothetical protein